MGRVDFKCIAICRPGYVEKLKAAMEKEGAKRVDKEGAKGADKEEAKEEGAKEEEAKEEGAKEERAKEMENFVLVESTTEDMSSTQVRKLLKEGRDVSHLITPAVFQYMKEHGLCK